MREQARAQHGYLAWTAALLTLAVALAGYAAFSAAQQAAVERTLAQAYGLAGPWARTVPMEGSASWAQLDELLDAADAEGAQTAALHWGFGTEISATVDGGERWSAMTVAGVRGAVDWDTLLLSGAAPGPGEVALGQGWAVRGGLATGDTVIVSADTLSPDGEYTTLELGTLTVSGFLREGTDGRYAVQPADAVLAWDDSIAFWEAWKVAQEAGSPDEWGTSVEVGAQVATASLERLDRHGADSASTWTMLVSSPSTSMVQVLAITAAVLAMGMVGTAFAVGRSQAQVRSRWIATARVLGARRAHVAVATALEVLVLGLAASAGGVAVAWGAVALEYAAFASAHPDALLPPGVDIPFALVLAIASLGILMAGILGAIPALWAARVSPAAALKPGAPATADRPSEAGTRRRPYGAWAILSGLLVLVTWPGQATSGQLWAIGAVGVAAGIATLIMLTRAARDLVRWAALRLAGSAHPWALAAGDALLSRPKVASAPAAVLAVGTTVLTAALTWTVLATWGETLPDTVGWGYPWLPRAFQIPALYPERVYVGLTVLGLGALTLASMAAFIASVRATSAEDAARRAMGLSHRDARLSMAVRFAVPLALGSLLGAAMGTAGTLLTFHGVEIEQTLPIDFAGEIDSYAVGPTWALAHATHLVAPLLAVLGVAAAWIAVGGMVAALASVRSRELAARA